MIYRPLIGVPLLIAALLAVALAVYLKQKSKRRRLPLAAQQGRPGGAFGGASPGAVEVQVVGQGSGGAAVSHMGVVGQGSVPVTVIGMENRMEKSDAKGSDWQDE